MNPDSKKRTPFLIAKGIFSIVTIIFAVLSIINADNWLFRTITQAGLGLVMLFSGLQAFADGDQKSSGYLYIGVAALLLFVMIFSTFVAIKTGAL